MSYESVDHGREARKVERPHPDLGCPKCGDPHGFVWSKPEYEPAAGAPNYHLERLSWDCGLVYTPVAGASA